MLDQHDMTVFFAHMLESYGFSSSISDDVIKIHAISLALRIIPISLAEHPQMTRLAIAIEAYSPAWPDVIGDTFLGVGATAEEALARAIQTWLDSTFTVIRAVIDPASVSDEVRCVSFTLAGESDVREWYVLASRLQTMGSEHDARALYQRLATHFPCDQLIPVFVDKERPGDIYWSKVFISRMGHEKIVGDCWLNNEPWQEGYDTLSAFHWPPSQGYRAFRQFVVFIAAERS